MSKLALIPLVPLRYEYPQWQEFARRVEKRLDEIVRLGTEVASTSGTSIDFTGIPSWVTEIWLNFVGVSTNGAADLRVQIGDAGGIETSGYLGSIDVGGGPTLFTAGFDIGSGSSANVYHGALTLVLENAATFTWAAIGVWGLSNGATVLTLGGSKSTSAALDRVRLTTANGTDTFDAGAINIRMT